MPTETHMSPTCKQQAAALVIGDLQFRAAALTAQIRRNGGDADKRGELDRMRKRVLLLREEARRV